MCAESKKLVYEYLFWTELVQKATSMSDKNKWQLLKTIHLTIKNVIFIITSVEPDIWPCKCKFFCIYRPYKESISKEMNNDDFNLHWHDQMLGWRRF